MEIPAPFIVAARSGGQVTIGVHSLLPNRASTICLPRLDGDQPTEFLFGVQGDSVVQLKLVEPRGKSRRDFFNLRAEEPDYHEIPIHGVLVAAAPAITERPLPVNLHYLCIIDGALQGHGHLFYGERERLKGFLGFLPDERILRVPESAACIEVMDFVRNQLSS